MLKVQLDEWLQKRGKTLYWLAKEVGVHYNTLWRIHQGKAEGIRFQLLEEICRVLDCKPGDLLVLPEATDLPKTTARRSAR
ncbi:MAG: helix-turn-helix domain-containing protein [Blastocatellia bacterium]